MNYNHLDPPLKIMVACHLYKMIRFIENMFCLFFKTSSLKINTSKTNRISTDHSCYYDSGQIFMFHGLQQEEDSNALQNMSFRYLMQKV